MVAAASETVLGYCTLEKLWQKQLELDAVQWLTWFQAKKLGLIHLVEVDVARLLSHV